MSDSKNKKAQLSRRTFVRRAGLLVSALGVAPGVQLGLMDGILRKATKKWGGEALAAPSNAVHFCIEINLRLGFQFNSLFPSQGHTVGGRTGGLNIYSSPTYDTGTGRGIKSVATGANPLYLASYRTGTAVEGAEKLQDFASRIATSEAIALGTGGHLPTWKLRSPNPLVTPCPAILHSAFAPAAPVRGIEFNKFSGNNGSVNDTGGYANNLARVFNRDQMLGLFRGLPMYFSREELQFIIGNIDRGTVNDKGAVGRLDDRFLARNVDGTDDIVGVSLNGRGQAQFTLEDQLRIAGIDAGKAANALDTQIVSDFGGATEMRRVMSEGGLTNEPIGLTLATIAKAFGAGAMTTATITLNSDDWHGDNTSQDSAASKQGRWNIWLGNALAGFLKTISTMRDPFSNDVNAKIGDSFFLSMSSEFTRTPLRTNAPNLTNNDDGGNQSFVYMGSNVRGGSYGNITNQGGVVAFNPANGQQNAAMPQITEPMMWKTAGQLMGIDRSVLDTMSNVGVVPCLDRRVTI